MKVIHIADAPSHTGPVPQAVESGGWIYVSALFGTDPHTGRIPDDARAEAIQMFAKLEALLAGAGARLTDVVRVGIFMKQHLGIQIDLSQHGRSARAPRYPAKLPGVLAMVLMGTSVESRA